MEIRALRENEQDACVELWRTVWPGDNEAYFRRYFEGDVDWLPYYTQVAVDGGRLADHRCPAVHGRRDPDRDRCRHGRSQPQ